MRQIAFFKQPTSAFGGELLKGRRKSRRPIDAKKSLHSILHADISQSGSFLKHRKVIEETLHTFAKKFGIKIYKKALVSNHIHAHIKVEHRLNYTYFIRAVTGILSKKLKIKWIFRPFTRVIAWGRDFKNVLAYVLQNELEANGVIPYQPRCKPKKPPNTLQREPVIKHCHNF